MSLGTIERERGDDRERDVSVERLNEMLSLPDATEPSYEPEVPVATIGEHTLVSLDIDRRRGARLPLRMGRATVQRVVTWPITPPPDIYKG